MRSHILLSVVSLLILHGSLRADGDGVVVRVDKEQLEVCLDDGTVKVLTFDATLRAGKPGGMGVWAVVPADLRVGYRVTVHWTTPNGLPIVNRIRILRKPEGG